MKLFSQTTPEEEPTQEAPAPTQVATPLTPEARLLAAGWACPDRELHVVIRRREALLGALAILRPRGETDLTPFNLAVSEGDAEGAAAAAVRHALGQWLDQMCGRPEGILYEWSQTLENQLRQCVYNRFDAVLASLEGTDPVDSANLRGIAERAQEQTGHTWNAVTRTFLPPEAPKVSWMSAIIPR